MPGSGQNCDLDITQIVDSERSLNQGAITVPSFTVGSWLWQTLAHSGFFDPNLSLRGYTPQQWQEFLHTPPTSVLIDGKTITYEGLLVKLRRLYLSKERDSLQPQIRKFLERAAKLMGCPICKGARLNARALESRVHGLNIAECSALQVNRLGDFLEQITDTAVRPVVASLRSTLRSLVEIGLAYLCLDRE